MGFDAGSAFSEALDRVTTQAALLVVGLYAAASILQTAAMQDLTREAIEELREIVREDSSEEEYQDFVEATDPVLNELPLAMGLDALPAAVLFVAAMIASIVVVALAIDAFARRVSDIDELDTSGLLFDTVNIFIGGIVYSVLMAIGFVLFFLPGIVVFVLFVFFPIAIVVEDENFVSAFGSSYATVRDNLGHSLLLVLLAIVVGVAGSVLSAVVTAVLSGTIGAVVSTTITAAATVLVLAMLTRAYVEANPETVDAATDEPAADAI